MSESLAEPNHGLAPLELPGWKSALNWTAAFLVAGLFLISGLWKITDAPAAAMRMAQARVPESLSLLAAVVFGIVETLAGVLIVVPRFRRWGAMLAGLLLVVFLLYFGLNYGALRGADCSCFPWVKRVVGPGFFLGDGIMLLLAVVAGVWSGPPRSLRSALLVMGAVVVFALVSYGVDVTRESGARAPATISVDGQPYSLQSGRVLLYFFHPQCSHCFEVAQRMARFQWGGTRVVAIPVDEAQLASQFLTATGLSAGVATDFDGLKKVFGYTTYPFGVAIQNGRRKASITKFDDAEPAATLKKLGFIE